MRTLYAFKNALKTCCLAVLVVLAAFGPASAQTTFGPFSSAGSVSVTDDGYNGTLGSMGSSSIAVSGVTGASVVNIEVDVNINNTWVGDLTIKLASPSGDLLTLVSRPGLAETVDDGTGCCGLNADWLGSTLTFTDLGAADAETMNVPFTGTYFPNPGITASPTQTFASLFGGAMNGNWTLYVGDAGSGDLTTLNSWSIRISTVTPSLLAFVGVAVAPDGDCTDEPLPATLNNVLNVAPGTGVCYFYYGENTGDVTLNLHDLQDDLQGTLLNGLPYALDPATSAYLAIGPVVINSNTTNNATWTGYNAGPTDVAVGNASATVFVSPANDLCADATPIACGETVTGTTAGSSDTDNPADCFVFGDDLGVWYSFTGTGYAVNISTCGPVTDGSSQAYFAVFEGDCGALTCVEGNAVDTDLNCGTANSAFKTIATTEGTTYYIFITHGVGFPNVVDFNLTLTCLPPVCDATAGTLTADASPVTLVGGSATISATEGTAPFVPAGYSVLYVLTEGAGLVIINAAATPSFTVSAAGDYTIHTLVYDPTTLDVSSVVFGTTTGFDVNGLLIQGGGTICGALDVAGAPIVVEAEAGCNTVTLDMTDQFDDGWNDGTYQVYDNSDPLNPVLILSGDLDNAASGDGTGIGQDILCLPNGCYLFTVGGGEYDEEIGWTLTGVDGGPLSGGAPESVAFSINTVSCDIAGCTDPEAVNYDPSATVSDGSCVFAPVNDLCSGAIAVSCGDVVSGTTIGASATDAPAGPFSISEGVWYSIVGTGGDFTVSTCSASDFDTEISVSEGSCGSLTWVGGNDDFCDLASEYTFTSVAGTTYYIYVGDWSSSTTNDNSGTFDLSITCTTPPCDATAGTLTADASPVTLVGGSATISATEGTAPFVPAGYSVLYVLTEGAGLVIINAAATPSFTVNATGDYTIHTLVYDPTTLDVSSVVFGTTTGFDVNGLLIQGGGTICGALDVAGAPIVVDEVVGLSESVDRNLSVYPNPSNGQFIVELNGAEGVGTLNIMDMMGRRVYTAGVNFNGSFRQSIDLNVAEGTYVLQVISENGIATRKVELN